MERIQRLEQAAKFAADQEQKAAKELAAIVRKLQEAEDQLRTLQRFRTEYLMQLNCGSSTISMSWLLELRAFLSKLGRAIEEQEATLHRLRQEYDALQARWRHSHCRRQGIEKLKAEWLCRRQRRALEQKEQRELDDRAARRREL